MKVSYKVLKKYIPDIKSPEEVAQDLIMHTAEVEDIHSQSDDFKNIVYGVITEINAHENADSLKVCNVDIGEQKDSQIVCGGSNLKVGQAVAVAKIGASVLWHGQGNPVIMKKTAIRGVESSGMICASEEIGLKDEFPAKSETEILDISHIKANPGVNLAEVLGKDDVILEVDNKAINHRPDLFSHIGIAREIEAISGKKLGYLMTRSDFTHLPDLGIKNDIPHIVKRYMGLQVSGVKNIDSPDYVKEVLSSHDIEPKGILVDITNYSLYLYGQPTHCFDADKVTGSIHIRFAHEGEEFTALNDKSYKLTANDIVIADETSVLALGGIIGGKDSAVSDTTTNIIIESAWFNHAVVRKSGKRLGLRTDALNLFEKDLVPALRDTGPSLIVKELQAHLSNLKLESFTDVYPETHLDNEVTFDLNHISNLIGKNYSKEEALEILDRLFITEKNGILEIPLWRKDITNIADIAEEIARLDGYDKIQATIPRINIGAVTQNPLYRAKRDARNFLVSKGYFEMYTYSFLDETLMGKALGNTQDLVPMKNALTDEMTHLRGSLIPNLLQALEDNMRDQKNMKLYECEKVFLRKNQDTVEEFYEISGVEQSSKNIAYYDIQNTIKDLFSKLGILKYEFRKSDNSPSYAHATRTANIIVRGQSIGSIGEIHPKVVKNFSLKGRVAFYTLNLNSITPALYGLIKSQEISSFQENNFDLNFVVEKNTQGKDIVNTILKTDTLIKKVDLFDVYEDEEKLPGKRSLSFKVYIQSLNETLDDNVKNKLIEEIVKKVEAKGGKLR